MSIFKEATKLNLTFSTSKGVVSINQLWSFKKEDLDKEAIKINDELESSNSSRSFISKNLKAKDKILKLKLDILLDILNDKLEEEASLKSLKEKKDFNSKIDLLIAKKKEEQLGNLSIEELESLRK